MTFTYHGRPLFVGSVFAFSENKEEDLQKPKKKIVSAGLTKTDESRSTLRAFLLSPLAAATILVVRACSRDIVWATGGIGVGIWIPARRAIAVEPIIALRYE